MLRCKATMQPAPVAPPHPCTLPASAPRLCSMYACRPERGYQPPASLLLRLHGCVGCAGCQAMETQGSYTGMEVRSVCIYTLHVRITLPVCAACRRCSLTVSSLMIHQGPNAHSYCLCIITDQRHAWVPQVCIYHVCRWGTSDTAAMETVRPQFEGMCNRAMCASFLQRPMPRPLACRWLQLYQPRYSTCPTPILLQYF